MDNKSLQKSLITMLLTVMILIIVYFAVENLLPILASIVADYKYATDKKTAVVSTSYYEEKEILYEDKQKLIKMFPNIKVKGKVYCIIYGKKVYENAEYLDLSNVKINEALSDKLAALPNLKSVNLYNQTMSNHEKVVLQEKYPNIVFKWRVELLGENVESNIETLDLSNKTISNVEEFKEAIKLLPNLKKLDMSNTNLSNEELEDLRQTFPNIRIDWVVHLGKWSVKTDSVAFSVLITDYNYRRMTSEDIQVLKYCTELQALDLGHQAIEDISVIGDYLPNLRVLILADNKIKDISPLAKLKHLHYLELFMNDITDVTPLAECKEMVDLNISFNYHFSNIDGILDYPLLERLWLISDKISAESYNKIRETYPNVKLVTTGYGSTNSGWRTHERYYAMIDMYRNNYISESFSRFDNAVHDIVKY